MSIKIPIITSAKPPTQPDNKYSNSCNNKTSTHLTHILSHSERANVAALYRDKGPLASSICNYVQRYFLQPLRFRTTKTGRAPASSLHLIPCKCVTRERERKTGWTNSVVKCHCRGREYESNVIGRRWCVSVRRVAEET